jgi:hypothetical protein
MAKDQGCLQAVANQVGCLFRTRKSTLKQFTLNLATLLVFTITSLAQQQTSQSGSQSNPETSAPAENPRLTVPVGTRLALVLTHPVVSRSGRRGDEVYAQLTDPVAVGEEVVIPAGIFVQGKIDKLVREGNRGELQMQSASLIFPNGYAAGVAGPLNIETSEGYLVGDPGKGRIIGSFLAPAAGMGLGALIGHAVANPKPTVVNGFTLDHGSTLKSTAIGSFVGLAAGGVVSLVMITHGHQFAVDVGAPMEMVLQQPLSLDKARVADAVRAAKDHSALSMQAVAPRPQPPPSAMTGTCYTPGTPGTPPTVIPGTPAIGGLPGTPDTTIPGTPSIPGTPYPCSTP